MGLVWADAGERTLQDDDVGVGGGERVWLEPGVDDEPGVGRVRVQRGVELEVVVVVVVAEIVNVAEVVVMMVTSTSSSMFSVLAGK